MEPEAGVELYHCAGRKSFVQCKHWIEANDDRSVPRVPAPVISQITVPSTMRVRAQTRGLLLADVLTCTFRRAARWGPDGTKLYLTQSSNQDEQGTSVIER